MTDIVGDDLLEASWVHDWQQDALTATWSGEWPERLSEVLDERWAEWRDATEDERTEWLTGFLATELLWITKEQDTRLTPLDGRYGERAEWLPPVLDVRFPEWTTAIAEVLVGKLDELLAVAELAWVNEEQEQDLDTLVELRGDWHEWLPVELDTQWPEWLQSTSEHLGPWLDELVPTLVLPVDAVSVEALTWVSDAQATQLNELHETRGDWRDWLPAELDEQWAQWRDALADDLGPWLDQLIPGLVLPVDVIGVDTLSWVTGEQSAVLESLRPVRGEWHDWLPLELDASAPRWRDTAPEDLPGLLDGLMADLAPAEEVTAALVTDALVTRLENDPEFARLVEQLSEEELAEVIATAAGTE
jgi:hypothetical protein